MGQYTITLSREEEKALLTNMISIQEWIDNAIYNKARQCLDEVCKQALEDNTNTILTQTEKQEIVTALASEGRIISTVKQLPPVIKGQIVAKARVKSASEKQTEWESDLALKTM